MTERTKSDKWRLVRQSDLTAIFSMLPPKPVEKDGVLYFYEDPQAATRLHQIRDAFDSMLAAATSEGISHRD